MIENEMVGWHHWLDGHELEKAPGVGDGHGSLVCCSPWDCKESDMTEWLNWTEWMFTASVMSTSPLILWCPLLLLPSMFPSICSYQITKILDFSLSISSSIEYSGLISLKIDWFYLLAVQGTFKSFSNTTVQKHQFFGAQLSLWSNSYIYPVICTCVTTSITIILFSFTNKVIWHVLFITNMT